MRNFLSLVLILVGFKCYAQTPEEAAQINLQTANEMKYNATSVSDNCSYLSQWGTNLKNLIISKRYAVVDYLSVAGFQPEEISDMLMYADSLRDDGDNNYYDGYVHLCLGDPKMVDGETEISLAQSFLNLGYYSSSSDRSYAAYNLFYQANNHYHDAEPHLITSTNKYNEAIDVYNEILSTPF